MAAGVQVESLPAEEQRAPADTSTLPRVRSEHHPNAQWLRAVYLGAAEIKRNDARLEADELDRAMQTHVSNVMGRFAPEFLLHTGGRRLAATGSGTFMRQYSARRARLSRDSFRTVEVMEVVADDRYGIVTGRFQADNGLRAIDLVGMGAWRFADGVAVEHWEMPDADVWDDFFLAADPDVIDGNAEEYWRRA